MVRDYWCALARSCLAGPSLQLHFLLCRTASGSAKAIICPSCFDIDQIKSLVDIVDPNKEERQNAYSYSILNALSQKHIDSVPSPSSPYFVCTIGSF